MEFDDLPDFMPGSSVRVAIGNVTAVVSIPALSERGSSPQCAVVVAPGNPARHLGSAHAGHPLFLALEQASLEIGFSCVRFDYRGIGMSIDGGEDDVKWMRPSYEEMREDTYDVVQWTKENLNENVAFPAFSMSTSFALDLALAQLTTFYMGLSIAPLVYKYVSVDPIEQELAKADTQRHKQLDLPTCYIVGTKDKMSPMTEMNSLIGGRVDGGTKVTLKVIKGADHSFKACEAEAAAISMQWIKETLSIMSAP